MDTEKLRIRFLAMIVFEAFHIRRSVRNDLTVRHLLNTKFDCMNAKLHEDKIALDQLVAIHYADPPLRNRINLLIYKITPKFIYGYIKILKKVFKKLERK